MVSVNERGAVGALCTISHTLFIEENPNIFVYVNACEITLVSLKDVYVYRQAIRIRAYPSCASASLLVAAIDSVSVNRVNVQS